MRNGVLLLDAALGDALLELYRSRNLAVAASRSMRLRFEGSRASYGRMRALVCRGGSPNAVKEVHPVDGNVSRNHIVTAPPLLQGCGPRARRMTRTAAGHVHSGQRGGELVQHGRRRFLAPAGEVVVLDFVRRGLGAHARDELLVEVLVLRAHAADVQRRIL